MRKFLYVTLMVAVILTGCLDPCRGQQSQHGNVLFRQIPQEADSEHLFNVQVSSETVTITGCIGRYTDIWIPALVREMPVTAIADNAFIGGRWVSSRSPFSRCAEFVTGRQLTSVIIPDSVTSIGHGAFAHNKLSSVVIPNSVIDMGWGVFSDNRLTSAIISNGVTSISPGTFSDNQLTDIIIPDSVTYIGTNAFAENRLTSITIPGSVTEIGGWAFMNNKISQVIIPDNVNISRLAFSGNKITHISIGNNVTLEEWPLDLTAGGFSLAFAELYESQGRAAGTFVYSEGIWNFQPR